MRYIPIDQVINSPSTDWRNEAEHWRNQVAAAANKSAEIQDIGNKWSALKPSFTTRFGDKCWYTEAPQIGTDNDVDHFRPKSGTRMLDGQRPERTENGVTEIHSGYWWLAFSPDNYRYSCVYANRLRMNGGKGEFFPLHGEASRAWCATDSLALEQNLLLDPCDENDVRLIAFDHIPGEAIPARLRDEDPVGFQRFEASRKHYNLNENTIRKARQREMARAQEHIDLLENAHRMPSGYRVTIAPNLQNAENSLVSACDRKSPFSAAVVSIVKRYRHEAWIRNVIARADLSP